MKFGANLLWFCGAIFIFYVVDRLIEIVMISAAYEKTYYMGIFLLYLLSIIISLPLSYYFEYRKGRNVYIGWLYWPVLFEMVMVIFVAAAAFIDTLHS